MGQSRVRAESAHIAAYGRGGVKTFSGGTVMHRYMGMLSVILMVALLCASAAEARRGGGSGGSVRSFRSAPAKSPSATLRKAPAARPSSTATGSGTASPRISQDKQTAPQSASTPASRTSLEKQPAVGTNTATPARSGATSPAAAPSGTTSSVSAPTVGQQAPGAGSGARDALIGAGVGAVGGYMLGTALSGDKAAAQETQAGDGAAAPSVQNDPAPASASGTGSGSALWPLLVLILAVIWWRRRAARKS